MNLAIRSVNNRDGDGRAGRAGNDEIVRSIAAQSLHKVCRSARLRVEPKGVDRNCSGALFTDIVER